MNILIRIESSDQQIELTAEEAVDLYRELHKVYGRENKLTEYQRWDFVPGTLPCIPPVMTGDDWKPSVSWEYTVQHSPGIELYEPTKGGTTYVNTIPTVRVGQSGYSFADESISRQAIESAKKLAEREFPE